MRLLRLRLSWKTSLWVLLLVTLPIATQQGKRGLGYTKRQILNTIDWVETCIEQNREHSFDPLAPSRIAHAGGGQDRQAYLNDKEALEANFALGFRIFELDFEWTSDGYLVLIHDWDVTWERFGGRPKEIPTRGEFLEQMARRNRTGLDLQRLCNWMSIHPDVKIVTDIKRNNLEALSLILKSVPRFQQSVIPQAYTFNEWNALVGLGFDRVILTVYKRGQPSFMIKTFITKRHPWGLTLPKERASQDSVVQFARAYGVHVFAHTVNSSEEFRKLQDRGVTEIYTDFLFPPVKAP